MERIKIERLDERTSKRGDKYLELRLGDGRTVYCFDRTLFPLARPGVEVEAELEANGRWPKVRSIRIPNTNGSQPADEPLEVRGNRALRAIALRSAAEVLSRQPKVDAERVLRWAETFLAWLVQD